MPTHLLVARDRLTDVDLVTAPLPEPTAGQVVVRVDRFAMTSNNLTYPACAAMLPYLERALDRYRFVELTGADAVVATWRELLAGVLPPDEIRIASFG